MKRVTPFSTMTKFKFHKVIAFLAPLLILGCEPKSSQTQEATYEEAEKPLTSEEEDVVAQTIYSSMEFKFSQWRNAIEDGDEAGISKYQNEVAVDLGVSLTRYPSANRSSIRSKVFNLFKSSTN